MQFVICARCSTEGPSNARHWTFVMAERFTMNLVPCNLVRGEWNVLLVFKRDRKVQAVERFSFLIFSCRQKIFQGSGEERGARLSGEERKAMADQYTTDLRSIRSRDSITHALLGHTARKSQPSYWSGIIGRRAGSADLSVLMKTTRAPDCTIQITCSTSDRPARGKSHLRKLQSMSSPWILKREGLELFRSTF
jgi:hypothetical protein